MTEKQPMQLASHELHILVSWGYAIRGLDKETFSQPELDLLERLKGHRGRMKTEEDPDSPLMWS